MFDLSVRLRENAHLLSLLSHYARLGSEDRTVWRDRLMRADGVDPEQLRTCPSTTPRSGGRLPRIPTTTSLWNGSKKNAV